MVQILGIQLTLNLKKKLLTKKFKRNFQLNNSKILNYFSNIDRFIYQNVQNQILRNF